MTKEILRAACKQKIKSLSAEEIGAASERMAKRLFALPEVSTARTVFIYITTPNEPQTAAIIEELWRQGRTVCVPKCLSENRMTAKKITAFNQLLPAAFGLLEPDDCAETVTTEHIDLAVIPCLSADRNGNRLGHGGGYYDRFLAETKMKKICLCFEDLLCENIPTDSYDIPMDFIISENGVYYR